MPYSRKLEKVTDAKVTQLALFERQNYWHYVHQVVILQQLRNSSARSSAGQSNGFLIR